MRSAASSKATGRRLRPLGVPLRGGPAGPTGGGGVGGEGEGLDAAEEEEAILGAGDGAGGVLDELELLVEGGVAGDKGAADHVAVAADVLGGGVEDDVGAELERALEDGRGEGVVHEDRD